MSLTTFEAVEQVPAEAALRRLGGEWPVRGGDYPQVEPLGAVLAEAAVLAVLEHPQQLVLRARRQLGHLVEQDVPPEDSSSSPLGPARRP